MKQSLTNRIAIKKNFSLLFGQNSIDSTLICQTVHSRPDGMSSAPCHVTARMEYNEIRKCCAYRLSPIPDEPDCCTIRRIAAFRSCPAHALSIESTESENEWLLIEKGKLSSNNRRMLAIFIENGHTCSPSG